MTKKKLIIEVRANEYAMRHRADRREHPAAGRDCHRAGRACLVWLSGAIAGVSRPRRLILFPIQ